jgi:4-hydroxy-tetrahydrodipicolinate synthase
MANARDARQWARTALHGVGNSLYTPFCGQDGDDIDWDAYSILVRHCVGTVGHSMLRVTSGLAEFWSLTIGERKRLLEVAVEEARAINKEVVVQSCTAALSAKECLELTRHAQQAGADIVYIQPRRDIRHGGRAGRQVGPRRGAGSRPVGTTRACRPRDCGGPV